MIFSLENLEDLLKDKEDEHLEFKEAKNNFHFDKLVQYCAALANELGGKMILGVTDRRPRRVVGTQAFTNLERTKAGLIERLRLRIEVSEVFDANGRVLIFHVPSRPIGMPIAVDGAYFMRAGEDLVGMTPDKLKRIFAEAAPDFSAEICRLASFSDLSPEAISNFRNRWYRKSNNETLKNLTDEQLLSDAEVIVNGQITYAALILFGTRQALGRHLAQAEVIFEYRSSESSGAASHREEYRQGFFSFYDDLWAKINLRNDLQNFQEGLIVYDIPTFNETACRESILNAVSHRDYRMVGSVFVRQYLRRLEIVSPGGFPPGVTPKNIIHQQQPRNRRIAEALARCGLVERSGQGANLIFENCVKESKPLPDFSNSTDFQVWLTLHGEVQDPMFLRFLERLGQERLSSFVTQDLLVLDLLNKEKKIPPELKPVLPSLLDQGVIEQIKRGHYILSRQFYRYLGRKGSYTRKRGLDHNTNKALLLKHIKDNREEGSKLSELMQVLPSLSRRQVQRLLDEMKDKNLIYQVGRTSAARWLPIKK